MAALKTNQALRLLLVVSICLATTLVLLIGTVELRVPGFSLFSLAHAMMLQPTCASTQGSQQNLCNKQNPVAQGCTQDAQTVEKVSVFTTQNVLIGEVDIRHSNICKALWVRTIAYANASQVQAINAIITFNDGEVQDHQNNAIQPGQSSVAFTDMSQPVAVPKTLAGVFHLAGQTQAMTILL